MKKIDKFFVKLFISCILLFLYGFLRDYKFSSHIIDTIFAQFLSLILFLTIILWGLKINKRILNENIKKYTLNISYLLLFWVFVRVFKFQYSNISVDTTRFLRYCYYIPMILIPLLFYFISLCIDKDENYVPKIVFPTAFSVILIFIVLTNNIHQLVFKFNSINDGDGQKVFFYFIIALWIVFITTYSLYIFLKKSYFKKNIRYNWLPFFVIFLCIIYNIIYSLNGSKNIFGVDFTVFMCFFCILLLETLVFVGEISSNDNYKIFFKDIKLPLTIVDNKANVKYRSDIAENFSKDIIKSIKNEKINLDENNLLYTFKILGGNVLWQKDISEINKLNDEIAESSNEIKNSLSLLEEKYRIKLHKLSLVHQSQIFTLISNSISYKISKIKKLLNDMEGKDYSVQENILKNINVIGIFIKRFTNMILINEIGEKLTSGELKLSLLESSTNLEFFDIYCVINIEDENMVYGKNALLFYEIFENIVEKHIFNIDNIFISSNCKKKFFIQIELKEESYLEINFDRVKEKYENIEFEINTETFGKLLSYSICEKGANSND